MEAWSLSKLDRLTTEKMRAMIYVALCAGAMLLARHDSAWAQASSDNGHALLKVCSGWEKYQAIKKPTVEDIERLFPSKERCETFISRTTNNLLFDGLKTGKPVFCVPDLEPRPKEADV